jgi:hypothetical protein
MSTVAEGSYFDGLASLANSLVRAGFQGSNLVGCHGKRPEWPEGLDQFRGIHRI